MARIAFFTLNAYDMLKGETNGGAIGGAQLQQILVGKELASRGHEIYFVEYDTGHKHEQKVDGINVVLKPRPEGNELVRGFEALRGTARVLHQLDPDVCYRRALDFEIILLSILCDIKHTKFVYGIAHDNNLDDMPDTFSSGIKSTRLYGRLNRWAISAADGVIAQNEYQYSRAQTRLDTNVYQITNCYEPGSPEPMPKLSNSESLVVLWVSRFASFKRPELVLDIAAELPDVEFVMIGSKNENALYEKARSRASELNNVHFEGFIPFSKIDRYFVSADIFLNTSTQEGFPNTFLQSWAYKKPVVSLKVDPNGVFSKHNTGWTLSGSVSDAVTLISELAEGQEYRAEVGERAYQHFVEHHSVEAIVDEYERVFTDSE